MILSIGKTVFMFVALTNFSSYDVPVTDKFCKQAQELIEKKKDFTFVLPDLSIIGKPIAVLCIGGNE